MIQEIEISKLRVHPKNVRKTYTNIDELADSMKMQGILQNLTVVKNPEEEGTYWVAPASGAILPGNGKELKWRLKIWDEWKSGNV